MELTREQMILTVIVLTAVCLTIGWWLKRQVGDDDWF